MRDYGELEIQFGTVYLNYCEIGKTLEDLVHDRDIYISDDAFKPFGHYSADFNVAFYNKDLRPQLPSMQAYIDQHEKFFFDRGIENVYNTQALPLRFPVADLEYTGALDEMVSKIKSRQRINQITIQ